VNIAVTLERADAPLGLDPEAHREAARREPWFRRIGVALVAAVLVLGLLNVFGQRPSGSQAGTDAAELQLYTTSRLRSGLIFEARFAVAAHRTLRDARLVLDPGWAEGITINTIEPSPASEASRDGRLVLDLGKIRAGTRFLLFVQLQVNPTNVGRRAQGVELDDGTQRLLRIDRTVTIFP
jgi:hypothetical protein